MDKRAYLTLVSLRCTEAVDILADREMITKTAKKYGVSRSTLMAVRDGYNFPGARTLAALSESGLSVDYMLGLTDKKEKA